MCASVMLAEVRTHMTLLDRVRARGPMMTNIRIHVRDPLVAVCVFAALYVALDWISFVHVLPAVGFTLWNPPPACGLALLLIKGFGFAPALFVVSLISDGLVAGFPAGLVPTFVADALVAMGYTTMAVALQHLSRADQSFQKVADVAWFLLVSVLGVPAIACVATGALALMHALPPTQLVSAIRHFWIGDLTGIVGLLPALLNIRLARDDWARLGPLQRLIDITAFLIGLMLALYVIFGLAGDREPHFFYLLLLPVIWIAVRRGLPWSAMAVLMTQSALIATVISLDYPSNEFLSFQILSLTVSATGLLVGAVVTERQRAEVNLRRQRAELERMARLTTAGALGMAVVHQISQPLATIATYTHACGQLLRRSASADSDLLAATIAKAEVEVMRAGAIVERLRDFLSSGNPRLSLVDLGTVAGEVVAALSDGGSQPVVDIQLHAPPVSPVTVDRIHIEQVLVNLIRNAIDATAGRDGRGRHVYVRIHDIGEEVEVVVEDDGPGISPEIAQCLFEPFETGKRGGMGLGLWLSRELVHRNGGRIWWDPATVVGARFVFRLPRRASENL
jgi:two-component system, LuxR family, sensor kinase FixL